MQTASRLKNLKPSYIREILSAASRPEVISLAGGLPAESAFPMTEMSASLQALASQPALFQYGETRGYPPLVDYLRSQRTTSGHDVMVCTGSQQALDLVARSLLDPGDTIVMESPGYLGAIQVFSLAEAKILPVRQLADGPDLDALESLFKNHRVRLFYAVADFHNPTGVCWSLEKREHVAALCRQHNVNLVDDCPYRQIRFRGESLPQVSSFCPEQSIVLQSFSKTIAPGMRFGIATAAPEIINAMLLVKQAADLHSSVPLQSVLLDVLTHPRFADHLSRVCSLYSDRYTALHAAITSRFGDAVKFEQVEGGMFVWLGMPGIDTIALARKAIDRQLAVVPGNVFYTDETLVESYIRLNFSHTESALYPQAMARLAQCMT